MAQLINHVNEDGKTSTLKIESLSGGQQKVIIAKRNTDGTGGSHSIVLPLGVKILLYREV